MSYHVSCRAAEPSRRLRGLEISFTTIKNTYVAECLVNSKYDICSTFAGQTCTRESD